MRDCGLLKRPELFVRALLLTVTLGAAAVPAPVGPALGNEPPLLLPAPEDCLPKDPPPPVVKIKVRVPAASAPGQPIEYHLCVENCSTAEAHHVIVKNPVPANAKFVRADPMPTRMVPELQWHLGTIGGGACREIVLVLQPTDKTDVKNCSRVVFEHGVCVTTRQVGHAGAVPGQPGVIPPGPGTPGTPGTPVPGVGEKPTPEPPKITSDELPKLAINIQGHKKQYVNLPSHYFITVTNTGKAAATNLLVSAALPAKATFVRASDKYKLVEGQVAWLLGDLPPGERRVVEVVMKATEEGEFCIKASTQADRGATDQAEACTQFVGVSALMIEMTDRDDPVSVEGKTSYPILIRAQGSAAVTNVQLKAFVPAALDVTLVKGPTNSQRGEKTPQGQWLVFEPIKRLEAQADANYEIFADAKKAGDLRLRIEVSADQLDPARPVIEEEGTTVYDERAVPEARPLSRGKVAETPSEGVPAAP